MNKILLTVTVIAVSLFSLVAVNEIAHSHPPVMNVTDIVVNINYITTVDTPENNIMKVNGTINCIAPITINSEDTKESAMTELLELNHGTFLEITNVEDCDRQGATICGDFYNSGIYSATFDKNGTCRVTCKTERVEEILNNLKC